MTETDADALTRGTETTPTPDGGRAKSTGENTPDVDFEAGAYVVTYERNGVVETAMFAGSAIVEWFEDNFTGEVLDISYRGDVAAEDGSLN